jgi:uncharacterized protein involved in exopolysaccharide biosynthesis
VTETGTASSTLPPAHARTGGRNASLLGLLNVVLRQRLLIAMLALLVGGLWVTLALLAPRTWTSTVAFMPQGRAGGANLPGVVAQLGINLGAAEGTASPEFYVDLVGSRRILLPVVQDTFEFRDGDGTLVRGDLARFYEIEADRPELAREDAIKRLARDVSAGSNIKTGVITVNVTAEQPAMAHQIAERVLTEVHEYNLTSRQRQAAADRRFTEERLQQLELELRAAEDRLQGFLQANRNPQAPRLVMQLERLQRDVAMQQAVYTAMAQTYNQARIEELRDTPVIATVQAPETPVLPDKRGLPVKLLIGLLLGATLGIVIAFTRDYFRRSREADPDEFQEFAHLRRATVDDVLHPWRPLGRAVRRRRA